MPEPPTAPRDCSSIQPWRMGNRHRPLAPRIDDSPPPGFALGPCRRVRRVHCLDHEASSGTPGGADSAPLLRSSGLEAAPMALSRRMKRENPGPHSGLNRDRRAPPQTRLTSDGPIERAACLEDDPVGGELETGEFRASPWRRLARESARSQTAFAERGQWRSVQASRRCSQAAKPPIRSVRFVKPCCMRRLAAIELR